MGPGDTKRAPTPAVVCPKRPPLAGASNSMVEHGPGPTGGLTPARAGDGQYPVCRDMSYGPHHMAGGPSENSVRDKGAKRLEALGCWVVKTTRLTPGRQGIPDLLVCDPGSGGRFIALEWKKPINPSPVTAEQRRELDAIEKAGGTVAVVRSVEEAEAVLRECRRRWRARDRGPDWDDGGAAERL